MVEPLKPGLFGGHVPVTQELLDDTPDIGGLLSTAMYRALHGVTVGGRWLRTLGMNHDDGWQTMVGPKRYRRRLNALRVGRRRGRMGYPPLPNRHLDRDLQRTWGYRTTIARYLKHHDN